MHSRSMDRAELKLVAQCRQRMAVGSLSFSLAARLLGQREQADIMMLYAWCRYCDDAIDRVPNTAAAEERLQVIARLRQETQAALRGEPSSDVVFQALALLSRRCQIPMAYFEELICGMEMDAKGTVYRSFADLELYCYRVAGVVGLMYCHIVGVSSPAALRHAVDLGIAMQLTNIARDVMADRAIGRNYFPHEWIEQQGEEAALKQLLQTADQYYASGRAGLRYLPFTAACAAAAAGYVYAAIGTMVKAQGGIPMQRAIVPGWRKLGLAIRGVGLMLRQLPQRLITPWTPAQLKQIWRLPQCHQ